MLAQEALLEPTAVADWLTVTVAVLLPLAAMLMLPRRLRAWTLLAAGAFGTVVILGDVIYYRFFGDILSAPAILGAHQTGRVWGTIRSLLTPGLVWLLIDVPFAAWMAVRVMAATVPGTTVRRRAMIALIAAVAVPATGLAVSAPRVLASTPLDQMFRDRAVAEQLGAFGYHAYDAWNYTRATLLRPRASKAWRHCRRQEPHRHSGRVAAGFRRRFRGGWPGGDAAFAPLGRRRRALHERDR